MLAVQLGWKAGDGVAIGLVDKGRFKVDEVKHSGPPDTVVIKASAADFASSLTTRREQSWHATTIGAVVGAVAGRNRLDARACLGRGQGAVAGARERHRLPAPPGARTRRGRDHQRRVPDLRADRRRHHRDRQAPACHHHPPPRRRSAQLSRREARDGRQGGRRVARSEGRAEEEGGGGQRRRRGAEALPRLRQRGRGAPAARRAAWTLFLRSGAGTFRQSCPPRRKASRQTSTCSHGLWRRRATSWTIAAVSLPPSSWSFRLESVPPL